MREAGLDDRVINLLCSQIEELAAGQTGYISEADILPVEDIESLRPSHRDDEVEAFSQTALIKLNGGLGTSMGMNSAKSLLPVAPGRTFLDIIVTQVLSARKRYRVDLPLVFMNSFRTEADTENFLRRYPSLPVADIPAGMRQNQIPKLTEDLRPVSWPADPTLEWCPPGHGDLYASLSSSGVLDALLSAGKRYVLVSNADNLGAFPDPHIAQWFAETGAVMAMEVCRRTEADRKGGHLARRVSDGKLILRELAQVPPTELADFQDVERHRYFNTNNIWLDLRQVKEHLKRGFVAMPIIRNIKPVDPSRPQTPKVYQVETGMGTAIESFDSARAIEVPRSRFLPVKTTNDLFLMRSELFEETENGAMVRRSDRTPIIDLDPRFFGTIEDFNHRCANIPSLADVDSLTVRGDYTFPPGLDLSGDVHLEGLS